MPKVALVALSEYYCVVCLEYVSLVLWTVPLSELDNCKLEDFLTTAVEKVDGLIPNSIILKRQQFDCYTVFKPT